MLEVAQEAPVQTVVHVARAARKMANAARQAS